MTLWLFLMIFAAMTCAGTLVIAMRNLRTYAAPPAAPSSPDESGRRPSVSVCIPARDEQENIRACVEAALAQRGVEVEVLVYDDESSDRTPEILRELIAQDERVRTVETVPLPEGWSGKQHACHRCGEAATTDWVLFTDADVRLAPEACARAIAHAERDKDAPFELVSTFPRQLTGTLGELAIVPMMFFLLFSYLPMARMRATTEPGTCAGCGQFLLARRATYRSLGGHESFRASYHDGIRMPRLFRSAGHRTDLFDGTDLVQVRMYRGFRESWDGFAKNAFEGLGSVGLLVFLTVVHLVSHLLPYVVIVAHLTGLIDEPAAAAVGASAILLAGIQRLILAARFRHPPLLAIIHPATVLLMTLVQWHSYVMSLRRQRVWRGRVLSAPESC